MKLIAVFSIFLIVILSSFYISETYAAGPSLFSMAIPNSPIKITKKGKITQIGISLILSNPKDFPKSSGPISVYKNGALIATLSGGNWVRTSGNMYSFGVVTQLDASVVSGDQLTINYGDITFTKGTFNYWIL
uniref:Uncharacterized protein n=1 Tax=viral metagenome TaxID=1070528 RepID=A0A6C0KFK1_9ZZZZ